MILPERPTYPNGSIVEGPRDLPQPRPGPRLRDPHADPGIHVPVPEDGAAGFRRVAARLRSRRVVRGAEEPQALHLVVSRRGAVPRGGDQRDPRRPREGHRAALHAAHREILCPRRNLHHGSRRASQGGMGSANARRSRPIRFAIKHRHGRSTMKHLLAVFAIAATSTLAAGADADKPSIETLFKIPLYLSMQISPDG